MNWRAAFLLALPLLLAGAEPPNGASLEVKVTGLRSHKGLIQACLTASETAFPECGKDPHALHQAVPALSPTGGDPVIVFSHVPAGRYAVALFHDENGNARLDKLMMIPREGFGFSRDAPVRFGPPRFAAAVLALGDAPQTTTIRLRYLF